MISILLFLSAIQVAYTSPARRNKLGHLVVAARVTRGYLPEPLEARERDITATVDSLTHHSRELRNAIKSRLQASYTFLSFQRPIFKVYAELSSLCFIPRVKTAGINERLNTALSHLRLAVPGILSKVKNAYAMIPEWTEGFDASYDNLSRELVLHIANVIASLHSLAKKQTLKVIFSARAKLLSPFMGPILSFIEEVEMAAMIREVSGRTARELVDVMLGSLLSNTEAHYLWRWSIRYCTDQGVTEVHRLIADKKNAHDVIKSLRSSVLSMALQAEYATLVPRCPPVVWRAGSFPGDALRLDRSHESVDRGKAATREQDRAMTEWIRFASGLFQKSLKVNNEDKVKLENLGTQLRKASEVRIDAELDIMVRRVELVAAGLK